MHRKRAENGAKIVIGFLCYGFAFVLTFFASREARAVGFVFGLYQPCLSVLFFCWCLLVALNSHYMRSRELSMYA